MSRESRNELAISSPNSTALGNIGHPKKRAFLGAYVELGCISRAAQACGCSRNSHYHWMKSDPDYRVAFAEAETMAADILEVEALRRAVEGVEEPVIYQGKRSFNHIDENGNDVPPDHPGARRVPLTVRRYSDTLLIFLMKGRMPGRYCDRRRVEHSGSVRTENPNITLGGNLDEEQLVALARLAAASEPH